ncbi:MAG: 16S rRNA (uracil(1498)-N(3))-methyltransferase [Chloroflexi bacterium]|nr:MAG: 16S rRNA (uracil(1498)-N(3))-methyltransferase [Chloroflexota bacterium]
MQRFFVLDTAMSTGQTVDLTPLAHQLHTVLRLSSGSEIILLDGAGSEFITRLERVERRAATGRVLVQRPVIAEPHVQLTLYQCSLKADKFEWVLQKGTELGVSCFVPVLSERSIVRPAGPLLNKYGRWRAILREGAEQCGAGRIPTLAAPLSWEQAIRQAQGLRFLAWEGATATRTPGLGERLAQQIVPQLSRVNLLIGPEGGVSHAEAIAAQAEGWQVVSLGRRVLRAETAAIAAVTIVLERMGSLGPSGVASDL